MKKVNLEIFTSRVAKRLFGLFVLSALIPLITISYISYKQISNQLDIETRRYLHRESKAYGQVIYDRLLSLEANMNIIKNELQHGVTNDILAGDEWLRSIFNAIYVADDTGGIYPIYGTTSKVDSFNENKLEALNNDETILQIKYGEIGFAKLFLIRSIQRDINKKEYLIGEINNKYLWNYYIASTDISCVLSKSGVLFHCSIDIEQIENKSIFNEFINTTDKNNIKIWNFKGQEYALDLWALFLDARFHTDDIFVLMAIPRRSAFSAFEHYKSVFPKAIIISGLFVILLSISQIRRYLIPLEKLTDGTKRISKGIFDKPVDIKSGDEFEMLGNSFNNMTSQIDEQIKTITTLAEIDRLILSSFDTTYIIETLIKHLHSVTDAHHISVITINDIAGGMANLNINSDDNLNVIYSENIILKKEEIAELETCNSYLLLNENHERTYLQQSKILGDKFFLIYPVNIKGTLAGIIILSTVEELGFDEIKLQKLKELSGRVAVALSNAAWEEKLYKQAHYDSLTTLPNRFLFRDRTERALDYAKREQLLLAILFIDLDKFKDINDSLGHAAGDEVLMQMASVLGKSVRSYDTLARFGGDEFAIMISDAKDINEITSQVTKLSSRIFDEMSKPFILNEREIYMMPSIGISIFPRDADNYDDLLKYADSAMYSAKSKGGRCYEFYDKHYNIAITERMEISNELRRALEKNELQLYYQPKLENNSNDIISAEALIRWQHPWKGEILPGKFIPIAESAGMIIPIENWVLETACSQNKNWLDKSMFNITLAINISAEQFNQPEFYENIKNMLKKYSLPPKTLELEITERTAIENYKKTTEVLHKLSELDIKISIDDFGVGYSSMAYLQKLPINSLKIDRSFIQNIPDDNDSISIVRAIIAMAHSLGLTTIAEGVETMEQYNLLRELECDGIQGYIISRPLPAPAFEQFMAEKRKISAT